MQRDFASDAAHQLRTPLTGIGLRLDEICRMGSPEMREEADGALTQVERLDGVIATLLARARGDSVEPTTVFLDELVRQETEFWRSLLARKSRSLVLDLEPRVAVLARQEHVQGALAALVDNAATHGSGAVRVTLRASDGLATITVSDAGTGVPPDIAPHVFERRFSGGHGTGIGLALARSLITAEGGTLALSSTRRSEFVLSLPLPAQT